MKILYLASIDVHISIFHKPYLKMLKDNNNIIHVATNTNDELDYCDKKINAHFVRNPFSLKNIKIYHNLKKLFMEEKYDVIVTNTPTVSVLTRLASSKTRKKNNTKVIYIAHGFHFYKGSPLKNWIVFYPIEKLLAHLTDNIITINKEDYDIACKKFRSSISYIPGIGIDKDKFNINLSRTDKIKYRKSLGLKENDFVIIYPARLDKNKNQLMIINVVEKLLKKHNNIKLLLPGNDELNGYYQNIVKSKKLNKNILFLGHRDDIPELINISNIAVSCSTREGLGISVLEALIGDKLVVAKSNRGVNELIKNNYNGYLVENTLDMYKKILYIIENNTKIKKMDYSKYYTDNIAKELLKIIDN